MPISTLLREAEELQPDVVRLRRTIHRHPELGLQVPRTQAAVLEALDGLGLRVRKGERLTSVVAAPEGALPGPILASGDPIEAVIHGRGGHASAPHDCLDPIPIACEIVQALQTFVTRRVDAFDPAVITIAKIEAGSTRNVIPETARMLGTIRTVSDRTPDHMLDVC